jgi:hypothetical protein
VFWLNDHVVETPGEVSWVEVLRYVELFLSTFVEKVDPMSTGAEEIRSQNPSMPEEAGVELAIPSARYLAGPDGPQDGISSESDSEVPVAGEVLVSHDLSDSCTRTELITSRGDSGLEDLIDLLGDQNSFVERSRPGYGLLLDLASKASASLTSRDSPFGYSTVSRWGDLARTEVGFICRLTASYYGCPAIEWWKSFLHIGKTKFRLISANTFARLTT